jgi:pSer/pThr/pTyr-binding forkhead associated (FHA) protein
MATTTFSGPIKAGTISNTTGTTVGTDVKNIGQVLMAQTFDTGTSLASGASAANETDVIIPANSQIVDIVIDVPTVMGANTCVFSVGDTVGGNATFVNSYSISVASGAGRKYPTTESGGTLGWADIGTADLRLTWTSTGATDAGVIRVTVLYQQNINLA